MSSQEWDPDQECDPVVMRYSGAVSVAIRLQETAHGARYHCLVKDEDTTFKIELGSPVLLEQPIDSDEAYDQVARAAIGFAYDATGGFEQCAYELDLSGVFVSGDEEHPWPRT